MTGHLSSLQIDELASGQAGDDARTHVDACARCRADLEAAEAWRAEFVRVVFPRTAGALRRRRWWRVPVLLVPALAVVALVWLARPRDAAQQDDIATKGGPTFRIVAKHGDAVFSVHDATRLAPGDQIRFVAGSHGPRYLLVASVDGNGTVTVYYPYGGDRSGMVAPETSELSGSIVLDAAPGPERVFALFSAQPLDAAPVARALRDLGARGAASIRRAAGLDLPAVDVQASIVFEKVVP